jgi:hypothetical protein
MHLNHRRNWGVVTAPTTKPKGSPRAEQNAGPERRLNLKNPHEPDSKERHGAGSSTETEVGAEHGCKGELGPEVRVTEKPPSTFEPGEPPDAILESRTERETVPLGQPLDTSRHRGREGHREAATTSHFPSNAEGGFWAFRLTFRVAEPEAWAGHLRKQMA